MVETQHVWFIRILIKHVNIELCRSLAWCHHHRSELYIKCKTFMIKNISLFYRILYPKDVGTQPFFLREKGRVWIKLIWGCYFFKRGLGWVYLISRSQFPDHRERSIKTFGLNIYLSNPPSIEQHSEWRKLYYLLWGIYFPLYRNICSLHQ